MHRFLRPGALARLRDSRIVARWLRSAAAATRLLPTPLPPAPTPPQVVAEQQQGGAPHFVVPARGSAAREVPAQEEDVRGQERRVPAAAGRGCVLRRVRGGAAAAGGSCQLIRIWACTAICVDGSRVLGFG